MARKSDGEDTSPEAPIRFDILSASTIVSGRARESVRDLLLVALTVASGAVDAISYFGLGKIFSAFMTGNMVFLAFGIAGIKAAPNVITVIFALSLFAAGSYLGLRFTTRRSGESGVWPPAMTVLFILVAIAEACFLIVWLITAGHPSAELRDVLTAVFSLAMGLQTAAVRSLGVQGIFTTAGTFTLVAFAGTFAGSRSRDEMPRLIGVLVGLVAGAVAGGLLFLHARSYAPVLPLVITVLVITVGWLMARRTSAEADTRQSSTGRQPALYATVHEAERQR
ncbi:MAG: hypothetical protein QOD58_2926 [Mycobacterium sp.]|nr:hypothetical protein [Mycobacterium sp.]